MPKSRKRYYGLHENSDPPPLWLPKGYIILSLAIEKFAEKLYPINWHQYSDEIALSETEDDHLSKPEYHRLKRSRDHTHSMICGEAAMIMLRSLHDGSITSCLFAEGQDLKIIPKGFWTTSLARKITRERDITIDFLGLDFIPIRGIIVAKELEFDAFVEKEVYSLNNAINLRKIHADEEYKLSPFILLMIKASLHFGLVNGQRPDGTRVLKKEIIRWLSENWPADLGQLSSTAVDGMATFIRHPQDGNGGITKSIGDKPPLQIEERKP